MNFAWPIFMLPVYASILLSLTLPLVTVRHPSWLIVGSICSVYSFFLLFSMLVLSSLRGEARVLLRLSAVLRMQSAMYLYSYLPSELGLALKSLFFFLDYI